MKLPLLAFLSLPLSVVAQYRPSYTPAPPRIGPSPMQMQQQSQQLARQNFQRQQAQQMQMMQQQMMRNQQQQALRSQAQMQRQMQQQLLWMRLRNGQQAAEDKQRQEQAEQQANEQIAQLAQEQQRKRLAQPAQDAQQAAAQQREDARQLTRLTVKSYQEVFLRGAVTDALQTMALSPAAQEQVQRISEELRDGAWWSQQDPAQAQAQVAAHSATLTNLTSTLLGYDIATTPPAVAAPSASRLSEGLANDEFDRGEAARLLNDAALAERITAGAGLARAVRALQQLAAPAGPPDSKKLRTEVKASLRQVNQELQRYHARVGTTGKLSAAQKAIVQATDEYLAKTKGDTGK
ncbi:hypothetical protein EJV47_06210 [Hymenobacter gummosus]|uniref:Uncharacterized protein n=1 Tax=Hymenobacter gummosus TaxID=1776032 RepID=A0A431U4X6_9BACT|nr:hypothetical protein [Hymenobacter gummosus]RTQ51395.1 hypothetical protein EJV47_06210 [Hymenobacter gummosus]